MTEKKFKATCVNGVEDLIDILGPTIEIELDADAVRRMIDDPDIGPELRARGQAFLAELEA